MTVIGRRGLGDEPFGCGVVSQHRAARPNNDTSCILLQSC